MAVRRTKKQKQQQTEKQTMSYTLSLSKDSLKHVVSQKKTNSQDMFGYSLDFIKQDLIRTIVVASIVVFILLVVVYFDLR